MNAAKRLDIKFMRFRRAAQIFSIVLVLVSISSLIVRGLNFGLDFTAGTLVEINYEVAQPIKEIRLQLEKAGFKNAKLVNFGSETDVLVRLAQDGTSDLGDRVYAAL